ncbi:MAG: hypothetical protein ACRESF_11510 [Pseudomonas sp.]
MAANPDDLQTIRDNLIAELKAETARRLVLIQAGNPPPMTYSVGGKQVSYNEYLTMMSEQIKAWNELIIAAGGDGGLYEDVVRGWT